MSRKAGADPRRFRLGGENEAAGAADAVIYLGPRVLNKVSGAVQVSFGAWTSNDGA